jgi:hypothetical protein
MNLLRLATHTLKNEQSTHGMKSIAVQTLLAAFDSGLETPPEAPVLVWRWLVVAGDIVRVSRIGKIPGQEVLRHALAVLVDADHGDDIEELAVAVIEKSDHVHAITDHDITLLIDRDPGPERARRLQWAIEAVHRQRGISGPLLEGLRDRWAASAQVHLRAHAAEIITLIGTFDRRCVGELLNDAAAKVRLAAVDCLVGVTSADAPAALELAEKRLNVEGHLAVRSELHSAIGSLLRHQPPPSVTTASGGR